jgi:hypothetical protein
VVNMHEEAVEHAKLGQQAAALAWAHVEAEYTQDLEKVLDTLVSDGPWSWTMPYQVEEGDEAGESQLLGQGGSQQWRYTSATTVPEIRQQYERLRTQVEIWGWEAMTELRQGWYVLTHGVVTLKDVASGEEAKLESVTVFPIGRDGILGEVQIGDMGTTRENRWPEVPTAAGEVPLPNKRLEVLYLHNRFVDALRSAEVAVLKETMRPDVITTIRDYTDEAHSTINTTGLDEIAAFYEKLFEKYTIVDVQLVNRLAESWFVFAELHWTVTPRNGAASEQQLEFCTADIATVGPEGLIWGRTGIGTDPVPVRLPHG